MAAPPPALEKGTLVGGKLRIVRTLGMGGMGAVYEVQHEITKHHRALKLLHPEVRKEHPDLVRRFLREASVAGTAGDPHIVETFDAGELETGEPYVLMELLEGESLADRLTRGPLPVTEAVGVVRQMCTAMAAAHAKGIVHRDLKPDNTFLCAPGAKTPRGDGGAPFVKVLDFGVSRFAEAEAGPSARTSEGLILGTPFYMPPEQAQGVTDLDARADVYALGVILYEALAGRRPFEASSMAHLVVLIHGGKAPPLASLRPEVPSGLADVIAHAMAPDRDQRLQDAVALGAALAPFVSIEALDQTQLAPVKPVAATHRTIQRAVGVSSPTLEPRSTTLGGAVPASPARWPWLVGAVVVFAAGLGLRAWSGGGAASSSSAPSSQSASGSSVPSSLPVASVVTNTPSVASVASAPSVPSASAPSVHAVVPASAVASAPKAVPSSSGKPASSGSSKSQQAGLSPEL